MKKYLFGILAVAMAVGFSAFTTKSAKKPFATTTYYYVTGTINQRVQPGHSDPGTPENSLTSGFFKNVAKWSTTATTFSATLDPNVSYIASVKFTLDNATDGDDDGELTLQEAIDATFAKYLALGNVMPSSITVDASGSGGSANIDVVVATAAH